MGVALMSAIVLAGGSGFLGRALAAHFAAQGEMVIILTRSPRAKIAPGIREVLWDGKTAGPWEKELDGARAVINLTGRSINCRYTAANRAEIIDSRLDSVRAIGGAIRRAACPPPVWVQAGSLAIYGDAGNTICTETSAHGSGFPVEVCQLWETAFNQEQTPQTRQVLLRIGFVLGADGGALGTLANLTRCFLGGAIGSGRQWISWMHLDDFIRVVAWVLGRPDADGVYNVTGPNPVTNRELMRALRHTLHRPWSPAVPVWLARLGARLLSTEAELALTGRRCLPQRLADEGFWFTRPALRPALADILPKKTP